MKSMSARGHCPSLRKSDVNSILASIIGSLFSDVEAKAALWQRPRRPPPIRRAAAAAAANSNGVVRRCCAHGGGLSPGSGQPAGDSGPLVLPPNSLLMLKRCSALDAAEFRIPDNLWARIVFDFLIAHRLRTINRGHLLGAMIPLYLAWVAGHMNVIAAGTPSGAPR